MSKEPETRGELHRRSWRADRRWQAGFLIGSAIGAAATVIGRRAERIARRGLVDWAQVEQLAIGRAERAPGRLTPLEVREPPSARDLPILQGPFERAGRMEMSSGNFKPMLLS